MTRNVFLLMVALPMCAAACLRAQNIPAADAAKHIGEHATVCGVIVGQHTLESARGKPTFVDIDRAFPHQAFTLVIWDDDKAKVGALPSSGNICVTGTITEHKGTPQMVLHDAKDWSSKPVDR